MASILRDEDMIIGAVRRASYRALLGREPEEGVTFADLPSLVSPECEDQMADIISAISMSHEALSRLPAHQQFPSGTWVLATVLDDVKIWADLGDLGVSHGCIKENYEPVETAFIDSVIEAGMKFVDIGANIGWFTMRAAKAVGPQGRVFAFEPRIETSKRLADSVNASGFGDRVTVFPVALGPEAGEMNIGYSMSGENAGGTWSLPTSDLSEAYRLGGHVVQPTKVVRLDDVITNEKIDIIKIDIEGAEVLALRGAVETIRKSKPIILCEINPNALPQVSQASADDLVSFIKSFGYSGYYLSESGEGDPIIGNVMVPEELDMINVVFRPE